MQIPKLEASHICSNLVRKIFAKFKDKIDECKCLND